MRAVPDIRAALRSEEGFGVVEMATAALLLAIGLVGAVAAFDGAKKTSFVAQRHEQAIAFAQREIEALKAQDFELLELNDYPAAQAADDPSNPTDPRAFVEGTNFRILADYHDVGADSLAIEALVKDPDADPGLDGVSIDEWESDVVIGPPPDGTPPDAEPTTGTVYRFITDSCELLGTEASGCPDEWDAKRLTVAVALDETPSGIGPRPPVYVSSVVTRDPPDPAP